MTKRISDLAFSTIWAAALGVVLAAASTATWAQFVTTPAQKATAQQVAQAGVPLSELSPNAPDSYTVKPRDTLWAISGMFLKSPWRWPALWGMNLNEIRNPHLIYPGQQLFLDKSSGRAVLRTRAGTGESSETVRVSPRTRTSTLADASIPTLPAHLIEPFLAEPLIIDETTLLSAPRIVATQENHVLLSRGDRAYARSQTVGDTEGNLEGNLSTAKGVSDKYRVFRNATPLKDPNTGLVIGYEAQYVGNAELVRGESLRNSKDNAGKDIKEIVPATIDIINSKEEMRVGDRLLPEPKREFATYIPRTPEKRIEGARIVSVYGNGVVNAAQNQVVSINRGKADGLETGHVLAIQKDGQSIQDRTDPSKPQIKLPDERNGLLMVFRTFDKLSYGLVLQITDTVRVGDHLINPR
jgi:LysM repeat protein